MRAAIGLLLRRLERLKLLFAERGRDFLGREISSRENAVRILHLTAPESEAHDDPN